MRKKSKLQTECPSINLKTDTTYFQRKNLTVRIYSTMRIRHFFRKCSASSLERQSRLYYTLQCQFGYKVLFQYSKFCSLAKDTHSIMKSLHFENINNKGSEKGEKYVPDFQSQFPKAIFKLKKHPNLTKNYCIQEYLKEH